MLIAMSIVIQANTTYVREYKYYSSPYDSMVSSRAASIKHITQSLSREIGIKVYSKQSMNNEIYKSRTTTFSSNIFKITTVKESWNGKVFYLKLQIVVDEAQAKKILEDMNVIENTSDAEDFPYYLKPHRYEDYVFKD